MQKVWDYIKKNEKVMGWMTSDIPKEEEWYKRIIESDIDVMCVNYPNHLLEYIILGGYGIWEGKKQSNMNEF